MATLAKQQIDEDGLAPVFAAATVSGDKARPGKGVFLYVKNTNGSTRTVTLNDPTSRQPAGATAWDPDVDVVVPATTGERIIALTSRFADPDDGGLASFTYSAVTGLTVAVFQAPV